jgi:hypothetical protein
MSTSTSMAGHTACEPRTAFVLAGGAALGGGGVGVGADGVEAGVAGHVGDGNEAGAAAG